MHSSYDSLNYGRIDATSILVQRLRSDVFLLINKFFLERGFTYVDPPILHEQIAEKKREIYLPLYENQYSLNSSNALYLGVYAAFLGNVYALSPTFRDEQNTINHLVEFRMLEAEVIDLSYSDLPDFVEKLIIYILQGLKSSPTVQRYERIAERIANLLFAFHPQKITYENLMRGLESSSEKKWGADIDPSDIDHEISNHLHNPIFIMDYPRNLASWTAKPQNGAVSCAINLMLPNSYGELCEGCERTNDVEYLRRKMHYAGVEDTLQWYLDAVSRITTHRCGFGIGIDRLIRWIVGLPHISNTVLFPRSH